MEMRILALLDSCASLSLDGWMDGIFGIVRLYNSAGARYRYPDLHSRISFVRSFSRI
jgi:hypothetical protein